MTVFELADFYLHSLMQIFPFEAPEIGRQDLAHLGDCAGLDPEERSRGLSLVQQIRTKMSSLNTQSLNQAEKDTLALLKIELEAKSRLWSSRRHLLPLSQLENRLFDFMRYGAGSSFQRLETQEDLEKWLLKLEFLPRYFDRAVENFRGGSRVGVTWPRILIEKIRGPLQASLLLKDVEHPLRMPFQKFPSELKKFESFLERKLKPSTQRLADYLQREYPAHCRETHGFRDQTDGEELYRNEVFQIFGEDFQVDDIHALGLEHVSRIREQLQKLIDGHALQNSEQNVFQSREEALAKYQQVQREIDSKLPQLFDHVPRIRCEIREVEEYKAAQSPAAYYYPGSLENDPPGVFYLNTFNLNRNPVNRTTTLYLHEANPGHHFQFSWVRELEHQWPMFRIHFFNHVYAEGWALYAEHLGNELGVLSAPEQQLGHLRDQLLRAARLVVDSGLHLKGWTRENAIEYFVREVGLHLDEAIAEIERYMVLPGQALSYYVGFLEILKLRKATEQRQGAAFDLRAFHRSILDRGSLPIFLLAEGN